MGLQNGHIYWTDDGSVAALRYGNWKVSFLKQPAHGFHVWVHPFEELRAPLLTNLRMDPFELAQDIGMDYTRWFLEHMFMLAPAAAGVAQWLQSFREFQPRTSDGSGVEAALRAQLGFGRQSPGATHRNLSLPTGSPPGLPVGS